ncbi:MAG: class I SAM-dependent methyltransferase [Gemmatimonadetes bacterium]|nr:class I SAM-dependent methyltransferase [Gemmatimonadota bacterium]
MSASKADPDWLALREPMDHRSRAAALLAPLDAWWRESRKKKVLDLGCGTGSNLRYLAPRLTGVQHWTLVDQDAALLERAPTKSSGIAGVASVDLVRGDLAREGLDAIRHADLVTASALLDLVSMRWLDLVVEACRAAHCAALFTLTWDGDFEWHLPEARGWDPGDALVLDLMRAHQRRDKGLGPALGPTAGVAAKRALQAAGLRTWIEPSPWRLGPEDSDLAVALIDGWAGAALEQRPEEAQRIGEWAVRRRRDARARTFSLTVGHVDVLALPGEPT